MSSQVITRERCPKCSSLGSDTTGDNLVVYADGGRHCFACGHHEGEAFVNSQEEYFMAGDYQAIPDRKISQETCKFFDYEVGQDGVGQVHIANYYNGSQITGQKIRGVPDKRFYTKGTVSSFFGQNLYAPHKEVFITLTEGEIDALSVAQVQGTQWPVVSLPNGAGSALKSCKDQLNYLKGFKHLVLCFDMDDAGRQASEEVSKLFDPGFVRVVNLPMKDANEMLVAGRGQELRRAIFNAQPLRPNSIVKLNEITLNEIQESIQPGLRVCYPKLNYMLNGLRKQSLYTLMARAKAGKTTITKEIVLDLVNRGHKVGVLYLEEDAVSEALSFVAMEEQLPQWKFNDALVENPNMVSKVQEHLKTYEDRGLFLYNHKGVIDSDSVHNTINFMVRALECEVIVLDNVSISIAGTDVTINERKMIDKMVYDLVKLINATKCTILTVVHVNQKGEAEEQLSRKDVFGSGAFLKFSRGLIALDKVQDGLVQLSVLGNRAKGLEGKADLLKYDQTTGRMIIVEDIL
jgi:twinkle protein